MHHPTPPKEVLAKIVSGTKGPFQPDSSSQNLSPETPILSPPAPGAPPQNIVPENPVLPTPSPAAVDPPSDVVIVPGTPILPTPSPAVPLAASSVKDTASAAVTDSIQDISEAPWENVSRSTRSKKAKYFSRVKADESYVKQMLLLTNTLPVMISMGPSRDPRLVNNTEKLFKAFHRRNPNVQIKELARMLSEGSIRVSPSPFECKDGTYADHELLSADIIQEVNKNPKTRERFVHFMPESVVKERLEYDVIRLRK